MMIGVQLLAQLVVEMNQVNSFTCIATADIVYVPIVCDKHVGLISYATYMYTLTKLV